MKISQRIKQNTFIRVRDVKERIKVAAYDFIYNQIPSDTGKMRDTLIVEWDGDSLVASVDTSYASFVRFGYVTPLGTLVAGRDFFELDQSKIKEILSHV